TDNKVQLVKGPKPLVYHRFYLDIEQHQIATKIETTIKQLGGSVEFFLNKDVTHFVTDKLQPTAAVGETGEQQREQPPYCASPSGVVSSAENPARPAHQRQPAPLPPLQRTSRQLLHLTHQQQTHGQYVNDYGPATSRTSLLHSSPLNPTAYGSTPTKAATPSSIHTSSHHKQAPSPSCYSPSGAAITRTSAATTTAASRQNSPVHQARSWGTLIWSAEYALKFLRKVLASLPQAANGAGDSSKAGRLGGDGRTDASGQHVHHLRGRFVKIESRSAPGNHRPVYQEFKQWPVLLLTDRELAGRKAPFADVHEAPERKQQPVDEQKRKGNLASAANNSVATRTTTTATGKSGETVVKKRAQDKAAAPPRDCGYCEICRIEYDSLAAHVQSDSHQTFVQNDDNFLSLDRLLDSLGAGGDSDETKLAEEDGYDGGEGGGGDKRQEEKEEEEDGAEGRRIKATTVTVAVTTTTTAAADELIERQQQNTTAPIGKEGEQEARSTQVEATVRQALEEEKPAKIATSKEGDDADKSPAVGDSGVSDKRAANSSSSRVSVTNRDSSGKKKEEEVLVGQRTSRVRSCKQQQTEAETAEVSVRRSERKPPGSAFREVREEEEKEKVLSKPAEEPEAASGEGMFGRRSAIHHHPHNQLNHHNHQKHKSTLSALLLKQQQERAQQQQQQQEKEKQQQWDERKATDSAAVLDHAAGMKVITDFRTKQQQQQQQQEASGSGGAAGTKTRHATELAATLLECDGLDPKNTKRISLGLRQNPKRANLNEDFTSLLDETLERSKMSGSSTSVRRTAQSRIRVGPKAKEQHTAKEAHDRLKPAAATAGSNKRSSGSAKKTVTLEDIKVRGIRWRAPSPMTRPPVKSPLLYKVIDNQAGGEETVSSSASKVNGASPGKKNGLIVKIRRVRQSELSLLNDEAENFMFPRKDDSSSDEETDDGRQTSSEGYQGGTTREEEKRTVTSGGGGGRKRKKAIPASGQRACSIESSDHRSSPVSSRSSPTLPIASKRARLETAARRKAQQTADFGKGQDPVDARVRFPEAPIQPCPVAEAAKTSPRRRTNESVERAATPASPRKAGTRASKTKTTPPGAVSSSSFTSSYGGDGAAMMAGASHSSYIKGKEDGMGAVFKWINFRKRCEEIEPYRFAFERVPSLEPWYETFQRQDDGTEKVYEYFGSTGEWKGA
ncbi:AGAP012023-PA, partial [Anopheles gambiae str. PEST]